MTMTPDRAAGDQAPTGAVVVRNTDSGAAHDSLDVPLRGGEEPYRFEMIYDGGAVRAYADTAAPLLECLIPHYQTMSPARRLSARISHATRTQVTTQADINHTFGLDQVTPHEYVVLTRTRSTPPDESAWTCRVPLVLVDAYYAPLTDLVAPVGSEDVNDPSNLLWLRPAAGEYEYLESLHVTGHLSLHAHADAF